MKPKYLSNLNCNLFIAFIYICPLIVNLSLIGSREALTGDFNFTPMKGISIYDLVLYGFIYLIPLLIMVGCIFLFSASFNIKSTYIPQVKVVKFLFFLLLIVCISNLLFGAVPVGGGFSSGAIGIIQKATSKINPMLCLMIVAVLTNSKRILYSCAFIVVLISYLQHSLSGLLLLVFAIGINYSINSKIKPSVLLAMMIFSFFILFALEDLLSYLYELRNSARGTVGFDTIHLYSYLIGRINSASSMIDVILNIPLKYIQPVSELYVISPFIERFISLSMLGGYSPTSVFNEYIIGQNASYSIFPSMAGTVYLSLTAGVIPFVINWLFFIIMLLLIYYLIPINNKERKIAAFCLILYMPYLSGVIWEFSIIFQSIIFIRASLFAMSIIKLGYKTTNKLGASS